MRHIYVDLPGVGDPSRGNTQDAEARREPGGTIDAATIRCMTNRTRK